MFIRTAFLIVLLSGFVSSAQAQEISSKQYVGTLRVTNSVTLRVLAVTLPARLTLGAAQQANCDAEVTIEIIDTVGNQTLQLDGPLLMSIGVPVLVDYSHVELNRKEVIISTTIRRVPAFNAHRGVLDHICPIKCTAQVFDQAGINPGDVIPMCGAQNHTGVDHNG